MQLNEKSTWLDWAQILNKNIDATWVSIAPANCTSV